MSVLTQSQKQFLLDSIRNVPDFPKPGIQFKDITTLLNDPKAFGFLMEFLSERYKDYRLDYVVGIESRGFIFGAALASHLGIGFVPIRKKGKLPSTTIAEKYSLEYGFDEVEIHIDAFKTPGARVLLIDDLIATGGTAEAAVKLIRSAQGECVEACFILNLGELGGAALVAQATSVYTLLDI